MATIKHRKNYQSDFKAKVALEAVKGRLTINEISRQFEVHPNQISKWKKQILESLPQIFDNSKASKNEQNEELVNQLYQQIGHKRPKLNLIGLKKNLPFSAQVKRSFVEPDNLEISVVRQCQLLGINRSRFIIVNERKVMRMLNL